jgi:ribosomal protein L11 methyltransferase
VAVERTVVRLEVPCAEAELAADALWQAGATAVAEEAAPGRRVRLTAEVADVAAVAACWAVEALEVDDSLLDTWRAHAQPVRAGAHVVLQPSWLPPGASGPGDVVVPLDPGRAFGSGSHPATRLAVAALEPRVRPGTKVLDVGCGSGVLAVVAARLGAEAVVAVDVDPEAVRATRANAALNDVGDLVQASTRPVAEIDGSFDLVLANIGLRVLGELAPALLARTAAAGACVLSGLLDDQAGAAVAPYLSGGAFEEVDRLHEAGWAAPVLVRRR